MTRDELTEDPHNLVADLLRNAARHLSVGTQHYAHNAAATNNDVATPSLPRKLIDQTEKRSWYLFEATRLSNA